MAKTKRKSPTKKKKAAASAKSTQSRKSAANRSNRTTASKKKRSPKSRSGPKPASKHTKSAAAMAPSPKNTAAKPSAITKSKSAKSAPANDDSKRSAKKSSPAAKSRPAKLTLDDSGGSTRSVVALATAATADAQGYVFINGRRVRMISTKGRPAVKKSKERQADGPETTALEIKIKTAKSRLNTKDLDTFRELLLLKRAQLVGDLSAIETQALQSSGGDLSHMPIHMADIGTDTYDQDFMLGLAAKDRELIRELDAALERIDNGTYGICQLTGKPIPKARLRAKPWAKHTIEAARQLEMGRAG